MDQREAQVREFIKKDLTFNGAKPDADTWALLDMLNDGIQSGNESSVAIATLAKLKLLEIVSEWAQGLADDIDGGNRR